MKVTNQYIFGQKSTPGYSGPIDNDNLVNHIHVEHRINGATGAWGKGDGSKVSLPQDWLK